MVPPVWYHLVYCHAGSAGAVVASTLHPGFYLDNLGGLRFKEAKRASPCISLHLHQFGKLSVLLRPQPPRHRWPRKVCLVAPRVKLAGQPRDENVHCIRGDGL